MPYLRIETNVSRDRIPANFLQETSALIAKILGKPLEYCVVNIIPDQLMMWGGDEKTPGAVAHLMSIGRLGVAENKLYSKELGNHFQKTLGIPQDRLYTTFEDAPSSVVGYNGTTFHDILG